jgi:site-specific DNA recombinase
LHRGQRIDSQACRTSNALRRGQSRCVRGGIAAHFCQARSRAPASNDFLGASPSLEINFATKVCESHSTETGLYWDKRLTGAQRRFRRASESLARVLVVNSVNRFARDQFGHFTVRSILSKRGITLRSATEPIDDSPAGKLVEGILATIAQFENDEKRERTKRGMKAALERGTWPFPVPLGYLKIPQPDGRSKIIQDSKVAPLIKQGFELFATGRYDRVEVLRKLSAAGLQSKKGRKLSQQSFCELMKKPFYAGKLSVKGWEIDAQGAFEAIISEDTFRAVQLILSGRRPTTIKRRRNHPDFPLRHFVRCGACERPLTG